MRWLQTCCLCVNSQTLSGSNLVPGFQIAIKIVFVCVSLHDKIIRWPKTRHMRCIELSPESTLLTRGGSSSRVEAARTREQRQSSLQDVIDAAEVFRSLSLSVRSKPSKCDSRLCCPPDKRLQYISQPSFECFARWSLELYSPRPNLFCDSV